MSKSDIYTAYLSLAIQALIPITLGSFKSLKTPATTLKRQKQTSITSARLLDEEIEEEDEDLDEHLSWSETIFFPVFGSVALLGLWGLLKYVGKEWINFVLGIYFSGAGMFAFQSTFGSILTYTLRVTRVKTPTYHIRISSGIKQIFHQPITLPSLLLLPFSTILPALYIPLGRPYILSNTLALCLATTTLAILKLDSFFTAFLLLGVLLIYDIFWVFATPVMVTVAKGIDAPIKILSSKSGSDFAMLGLGDIVVPGLVIALCLRYDLHRYTIANPKRDVTARTPFGKPYFWTGIISYILGLGVTIGVMHYTRHAQPALLYLSPACTLGPVLLAAASGDLKSLWSFSDAPAKDNEKEKKLDETIESASEVAQYARQAIKQGNVVETLQDKVQNVEDEKLDVRAEADDESWMETGTDTPEGKARRRKGGKRK